MTLKDGRTAGIPYPHAGYNCHADYSLVQTAPAALPAFDAERLEHCPDFDERMTLKDGLTRGIAYPKAGYNCHSDWALVQEAPATIPAFDAERIEHCPDFDERMTLKDGRTTGIAFPNAGYNCHSNWSLVQEQPTLPGFDAERLEHCPDFNERMTLKDGRTAGIPYPHAGFNCHGDYALVQDAPAKFNPDTLEHCPDFWDDRHTLTDGRTEGIPYPKAGFNCHIEWS
jgi:hypothetical protein